MDPAKKRCAVMILVYGDESMDETSQRVCAVAGAVGTIFGWRALERQWLAMTDGIPFHAADCDSDKGDYRCFSHQENKKLYQDLTTLVAESHIHGLGVAIDLIALRKVFPVGEDLTYYRSFLRVMEVMKNCAKGNGDIAELTFDMRLNAEHNAGLLYGTTRENEPEWAPYLADKISFEFARKNPRIQVADLLAHEAMKALDSQIAPVKRKERKSWKALRETGRFEVEAYSNEWFDDMKRQYADLERKVGFCKQDYMDWLDKRKRQHNVTNMFWFVDWIAKRDANAK